MLDTMKYFVQQRSSTLVFFLASYSSIYQVPYFILNKVVTESNLTRLLLRGKKILKKKHLGQVFKSVMSFLRHIFVLLA